MSKCPLCQQDGSSTQDRDYGDKILFDCHKCGRFEISRSAVTVLENRHVQQNSEEAARLSHALFASRIQDEHLPMISTSTLDEFLESPLPNPHERADNFVEYLGREAGANPGAWIDLDHEKIASAIGGLNGTDTQYCVSELTRLELVKIDSSHRAALTLQGWARFDELRKTNIDSRRAFMAMPFNNSLLDSLFHDFFKPAVRQTGFDLYRIDENPPAGSIDDRLRVEIRRSRFLIAELTDDNSGAYWEAGFAEGLERPVIYTCSNEFFDDKGTHFDTNHCHTIIWDPNDLQDAAVRLKATIRATLPAEAMLEDGPT